MDTIRHRKGMNTFARFALHCLALVGMLTGCSPAGLFAAPATATPTATPTIAATPTITITPTITPTRAPTALPTLTPLGPDEAGKGHLHGQVVYECNRRPVTITYYTVLFGDGTLASNIIARVDEKGEFWIKNLKPGDYSIHSTRLLNVAFTKQGDPVTIRANETTEITLDTIYCPTIKLLSPIQNAVVKTAKPVFEWKYDQSGVQYVVRLDGDLDGYPGGPGGAGSEAITNITYTFSNLNLGNNTFTWEVCVLNPNGPGYTACSLPERFTVQVP